MSSSASPGQDALPHRFQVLQALRCLALGRPLVVFGPSSWELSLEGAPYVAALYQYFLDHDWLQPLHYPDALPGVGYYGLSPQGHAFLEKGEAWWASLRRLQKIRVYLLG